MTDVTVDAYLERIGVGEAPAVGHAGLTALMRAHLSTVPFENIDVYRQTGVRTDLDWSLSKIVSDRRGGWCFENNGAFGWLLRQVGFDVTYLGAYVLLEPGDTDNMSHLCLRVDLDRPYLVDVGFGDAFNVPLPLVPGVETTDGNDVFSLREDGAYLVLEQGAPPQSQYRFTLQPRTLPDFEQQSDRLQTLGVSGFTEKPFATKLIDSGDDRITLLKDRMRTRTNGEWSEKPVQPEDWNRLANEVFGLDV